MDLNQLAKACSLLAHKRGEKTYTGVRYCIGSYENEKDIWIFCGDVPGFEWIKVFVDNKAVFEVRDGKIRRDKIGDWAESILRENGEHK